MFSILGISLIGERMGYCDLDNFYYVNRASCESQGRTWKTYGVNFDHIMYAMNSLFILSTQEGWPTYMFQAVDSDTSDVGPHPNAYSYIQYYYIGFIFIGSYFLINLFVGVIFYHFNEAQKNVKLCDLFLTPEQQRWIEFQRMIIAGTSRSLSLILCPLLALPPDVRHAHLRARANQPGSRSKNSFALWRRRFQSVKTEFAANKEPTGRIRRFFYHISQSKVVDIFILLCIILNIITMGMVYEEAPTSYISALETINLVFTSVFILEMVVKMIGLGFKGYFLSGWNQFDCFVVLASIVDIAMSQLMGTSLTFLRVGPQLIRILRVLRVSRLLKLVKSMEGLHKIIQTLIFSIPSLINIGSLMALFFFIFAVLGVFLFKDIKNGSVIDHKNNFSNFGFAMIALFR